MDVPVCLPSHLLVDIWVDSSLGALLNKAAVNMSVWVSVWTQAFISPD